MSVLGAHAYRHGFFLLACMAAASVTLMMFMPLSSSRTPTVSCRHVSAYGLLSGCAHALLSMWVYVHFFSAICNEHWALISFSDISVPACHCLCGYTLTIPPPHTLPYYPQTQHPPCPVSQATIGGGLPLSIMGAGQRNLRSARRSAEFVFVYTQHGPPRSHTWPRTLTAPLHATTLHSHLPPTHTFAPHSHLYFGYKLPVRHVPLGLDSVVAKDRTTLPANTQPPHALAKHTKEHWLYPPPPSTKERSSVGCA